MYPFWKRLGNVCTDFCAAAMNTFPICSLKNVYTLNAHWIDDGADFSLGSPVVRRSHGFIVTTVVGAINFYIYSGETKRTNGWVGVNCTYTKISRLEQKVSLCNIRSFVQLYNILDCDFLFCFFFCFFFPFNHTMTQHVPDHCIWCSILLFCFLYMYRLDSHSWFPVFPQGLRHFFFVVCYLLN